MATTTNPSIPVINFLSGYRMEKGEDLNFALQNTTGWRLPLTARVGGANPGTQCNFGGNLFNVVTNANDSCSLPPAYAGSTCMIANVGANTLTIYALNIVNPATNTLDTVNGASSVTLAPNAGFMRFFAFANGIWISNATVSGGSSSLVITTQDNIVAFAGGGIGSATAININAGSIALARVTTVASTNDSVILPASQAGSIIKLINQGGGNAMQVFATGSDTIDGTAGSTGISQLAGTNGSIGEYLCLTAGQWISGAYYI